MFSQSVCVFLMHNMHLTLNRSVYLILQTILLPYAFFHPDERLTNFTVEVHASDPMTSNNTGLQVCYLHEGTVGSGLTVDLTCAVNTIGRYVRIVKYNSGDAPLTLCEVAVRGAPVRNTGGVSYAVFSRHSTGARESHNIIASHENIRNLDCAKMCLRKATCNAFNTRSPSMGVVSCELLAVALDPVANPSWDVYEIIMKK
ncbi:uncharacterized protein LOC124143164 [Haliotis rufescens]|uniref:uncharacterized protein LOC124143164 n=1 Tax=Haliotis rufescens TaxID=6454 RepID=UPI00201F062E|nr:uncharacterized protein LOC124143164 [Haliotis rufescens]